MDSSIGLIPSSIFLVSVCSVSYAETFRDWLSLLGTHLPLILPCVAFGVFRAVRSESITQLTFISVLGDVLPWPAFIGDEIGHQ
jgi:hypothetical protein